MRLNARLRSALDSVVEALAEYQAPAPKAALLAEYVAELFVAGRREEASAWMPLAQLYTALWQARSAERLQMVLSDIRDPGLPDR